ncbi:hypothetical protein Tco_0499714 [Tanacetum coccineum]
MAFPRLQELAAVQNSNSLTEAMSVYIERKINKDLHFAAGLSHLWEVLYSRVNEHSLLIAELNVFGGPLALQCDEFLSSCPKPKSQTSVKKSAMDRSFTLGSTEEADNVKILQSCNGGDDVDDGGVVRVMVVWRGCRRLSWCASVGGRIPTGGGAGKELLMAEVSMVVVGGNYGGYRADGDEISFILTYGRDSQHRTASVKVPVLFASALQFNLIPEDQTLVAKDNVFQMLRNAIHLFKLRYGLGQPFKKLESNQVDARRFVWCCVVTIAIFSPHHHSTTFIFYFLPCFIEGM